MEKTQSKQRKEISIFVQRVSNNAWYVDFGAHHIHVSSRNYLKLNLSTSVLSSSRSSAYYPPRDNLLFDGLNRGWWTVRKGKRKERKQLGENQRIISHRICDSDWWKEITVSFKILPWPLITLTWKHRCSHGLFNIDTWNSKSGSSKSPYV